MTRKIVFHYHTGYCGSDGIDFYEVPDDVTDEELYDFAHTEAVEHASRYGIYPEEERPEDDGFDDMGDEYSYNIEGWFEEYNPEEHDGMVPGGGPIRWAEF
ncbi:hypothetical protein UFOVP273_57 [uncultured Caudovirales phage]|uniref:Uncharacterized protein n=1 Tax=uncultured Caudovirales phage TaxID=2100421 RepID=A0A6J5LLR1_9CAUD|nr:hypothetical protein UFOVP273_57 [uncultured Caudovirales phage]